ncbi:MAG: chemotaxis-specific protein-glutamate methyltransferase CheB [Oscillospiraceae bacterium]|nr:chemotaxis-specific protein-glutamate methyltransferase CheB [Oscillospiraceae bacterium]
MLKKGLARNSDIDVVGEASDPYEARDKILSLEPDVMTLDIEMPHMDGVEFLKILLPQWEIPVIVSSSLENAENNARRAGAADFLLKPDRRRQTAIDEYMNEMARKIRKAYGERLVNDAQMTVADNQVIALGASTGGTEATKKIIRELPPDTPGMVVVQHMPPNFTQMYAEGMNRDCRMTVIEATNGAVIKRGQVLIAPGGDKHMEVKKSGHHYCVYLRDGEKVSGHSPSVDVLFYSMSRILPGKTSMGILLTGMGGDGAKGLLAMRQSGSHTIGQDEKTSVVYGMPKEAFDIGAVTRQVPLGSIAGMITQYFKKMR